MAEDNKKVNIESGISAEEQSVYEQINVSTDEMVAEYDSGLSREEKLRLEAEKKDKLEMEAIRRDIEMRYSQEISATEKSIESIASDGETETVKADEANKAMLDEMINLDAFVDAPVKKSEIRKQQKTEKKAVRQKEIKIIDLDEKSSLYSYIYILGDVIIRSISFVFLNIISVISVPFRKLRSSFLRNFREKGIKDYFAYMRSESKQLRREIATGFGALIGALGKPKTVPSFIAGNIRRSVRNHNHFIKTVGNILLPVVSLIIMIAVFNYWNNKTFALKVLYGDKVVGFIEDETVLTRAEGIYSDRLASDGISSEVTTAVSGESIRYELAVVSLDKLDNADIISDSLIENSADNLIHACGVYIDGKFICAVMNEADAKTVFYNILKPYEETAEEGCVPGILQNVDYVQGLYSNVPEIMWDASKLEKYISANDLVKVKMTYVDTETVSIPYATVTTRDASKYSGYRVVNRKGQNGSKNVITSVVYVDGELYTTYFSEEILVEPVDELLTVGGRTTYGGVYIGEASDMGFLWPAPHCHYISSPYGWRRSGWHKGIDLCTRNGTAKGSPVIASRAGTVELVQRSGSGYGNMVLINHGDGYKTRYAHLLDKSITVKIGDYVEGGQTIGKVGSTGNSSGPHLHFEVIYNGETYDPSKYISQ